MPAAPDDQLNLVSGILAVLFPGAGHIYLKQTRRGVFASIGVLGLFLGGILIGGVDVIDRKEDKWWFLGQAMVGPLTFGVDYYHQHMLKAYPLEQYEINEHVIRADRFNVLPRRSLLPGETRKTEDFQIVVIARDSGGRETGQKTVLETRSLPYAAQAGPGQGPPNTKSIGRMNELGMLSATIAGMLNFIIILDALFPVARTDRRKPS